MISKEEISILLHSTESFRVERTISTGDMDKFQEAICAFANDLPNSRQNGYLIIGAEDNGNLSGLRVTDDFMKRIASIRSNGIILPLPLMNIERYEYEKGDLLIVEVQPSFTTPVRYRGCVFIRIGPRRDIASEDEERILTEKRVSNMGSFDASPCFRATMDDLLVDKIEYDFIPKAVDPEILASDKRDLKHKMASLGLFDLHHDCPTCGAIILFGRNPKQFLHGSYVQYGRFGGKSKGDTIIEERSFNECLAISLHKLENFIEYGVCKTRPVFVSAMREEMKTNYPKDAMRELIYNACMHTDYQSNMPTRFYNYNDRIEIMNPGGLYGKARPENFRRIGQIAWYFQYTKCQWVKLRGDLNENTIEYFQQFAHICIA
ncbi:MAG: putative DNA binding domain-containing protein, partial [Paludibacteraceae bacterium]|nr:putative DNA binding domain-containing protein [Paludibacteraceae bacterium]